MSGTVKVEAPKAEEAAIKDEAVPTTAGATEEEDKAKCLKQGRKIEFYLSDSNLPYDKFMWSLHTKDAENHWIPIKVITGFKRMADYKKYDAAWVADVLRSSAGLLEVDEAGEKVRRATPLLPPGVSQLENSVYAKGFPDETPGVQKQFEAFFEEYAPIAGVRMRREDKKKGGKFKNSVFCEFKTKAGADTFLAADPKPTFEGKELLIMSKEAYIEMKSKEKGFAVPDKTKILPGNVPGRTFNAFKLMEEEAAKKAGGINIKSDVAMEEAEEKQVTVAMEGKTYDVREDGTVDESELDYPKNRVLVFSGAGEDALDIRAMKTALEPAYKAKYITKDYENKEFSSGFVLFESPLTDLSIENVTAKLPKLGGNDVTWSAPSEETDRRFWLNRLNHFAKQALEGPKEKHSNSKGRGGGRGGRGGGRGGRGRGGHGGGRGGGKRGGGGDRGEKRKAETEAAPEASASSERTVPTVATTKKPKLEE